MTINSEQIDELKKRANVSYEDAKSALEQSDGDLVSALVFLEKQNNIKSDDIASSENRFFKSAKQLIKKGNETNLIVKKDDSVVLNICVTLGIVVTVVAPPVVIIATLLALATNHKIRIQKKNNKVSPYF